MADLNKVSGSKYDIYEKFMAIAEHYFGTNTDYLRSGFMAYTTECMASIMRDSALHKTMLYNESFLNTAVMPKSIYNWAKMFNIEVSKAKPAFTDVMITINVNDLENMYIKKTGNSPEFLKYGLDVTSFNNSNVFVIDRGNPLIAGNFYFSLERSIIIYKDGGDSTKPNQGWIVKYCTTETPETTHFGDFDETFLKTVVTSNGSNKYLSFIVRVWQYKTVSIEKQITSSSFADTKIHTFEFTDQLAGLRLQYKKNNITTHIPLIFADSILNTNELYAYYSIIDENKVQIKFMNDVFLPSVGGQLKVDLYTTFGSAGNYSFTSDLVFTLSDEDYRSLALTTTFVDYQSYAGTDTPTLQQIKSNIISDISTRNIIVTESDLNTYFFKLASLLESINDGKVEFVKKRDDIIKRTFNAYLLLRTGLDPDGNSNISSGYRSPVIPTNTVDVQFPITENISKPFGSLVRETSEMSTTSIKYEYVPDELSEGKDYYVIPFYMRVLLNPIKKVKYIYNVADDSTALKYKDVKKSGLNYIITPSTVNVKRNIEGVNVSDWYQINFTFATNFDMSGEFSGEKLNLKLYTSDTIYNIINLKMENSSEYNFTIESILDENSENIYQTTFKIKLKVAQNEFNFSDINDYGSNLALATTGVSLLEDMLVGLDMSFSKGSDTFDFDVKSDRKLGFFRSLDSIMNSDIILNKEIDEASGTTTTYIKSITLKEVPIVHSSFFNNQINQSKFIKQLFTYVDLLKQNMNILETNTFFNLKFMNTYGYSQLYDTQRTNLNLEMTIYLNVGETERTKLEKEIRDYIRVLVDKYNNDTNLSVSTIITLVTAAYSNNIDHIVFEGLNGTFSQYIKSINTNDAIVYVPEYFSLDAQKLQNSIKFK